ncbi:hypothetical protein FACS1894178_8680 [Bacteroidia bacterium]|nr:hypothetical protein FACS1894178_8680 [Bacteroidia bacterium]
MTSDYLSNIVIFKSPLGNLVAEMHTLTENGYIKDGMYHYFVKDYLGNNRLVMDEYAVIIQQNNYYPFGMTQLVDAEQQDAVPYKFSGKELESEGGLNWYDFSARFYDASTGRFGQIDPMAEKYYPISPYAYCGNNPLLYVDPLGMDVYRYDDKTGDMILFRETKDDFDQIGKFKYDKKTDTYTLKEKKDGTAKTRIDNIEKGILSDGMNFKNNDNLINVGGEGQPTIEGVQNFVIELSEMVGKEIGGYHISDKGSDVINQSYIVKYKNNTDTKAFSPFTDYYRNYYERADNIDIHVNFHTHLSRFSDMEKLYPSKADINFKTEQNTVKRFIILTRGYSPINY